MKLLIALLIALPAQAHAGACAQPVLAPQVLSDQADPMPTDGGVLVGWQQGGDWQHPPEGDPSLIEGLVFRDGSRRLVKAHATTLAPGLTVYVPKKHRKKLSVRIKGQKLTFTSSRTRFTAPAPVVKSVTWSQQQIQRYGTSTSVDAELDGAPPDDVYAVIVYDATSGTALSWRDIHGLGLTTVTLYTSPGRCGTVPPSMQAPTQGESVQLAWVDRFGRLSPKSSAVTVGPP